MILRERIWNALNTGARGKANAIRSIDLAPKVGLSATKQCATEVRNEIREMRLAGYPVCGLTSHGFFVPETQRDVDRMIAYANRRIDVMQSLVNRLRQGV